MMLRLHCVAAGLSGVIVLSFTAVVIVVAVVIAAAAAVVDAVVCECVSARTVCR